MNRALPPQVRVQWGLAILLAGVSLWLHVTREPSTTELGWQFVSALQHRDARGIARMFSDEELQAIGVSRAQATKAVEEIVLPQADALVGNIVNVTIAGNSLALERPHDDPRYIDPPQILLGRDASGRQTLALGTLIESVWGSERIDNADGLTSLDYRAKVAADMDRLRQLGIHRTMDWSLHEAHELPDKPFFGT